MVSKAELKRYIAQRTYHCPCCKELQRRVATGGLTEIKRWDGMICGSIEDMQIRLQEIETGKKYEPLDFKDLFA